MLHFYSIKIKSLFLLNTKNIDNSKKRNNQTRNISTLDKYNNFIIDITKSNREGRSKKIKYYNTINYSILKRYKYYYCWIKTFKQQLENSSLEIFNVVFTVTTTLSFLHKPKWRSLLSTKCDFYINCTLFHISHSTQSIFYKINCCAYYAINSFPRNNEWVSIGNTMHSWSKPLWIGHVSIALEMRRDDGDEAAQWRLHLWSIDHLIVRSSIKLQKRDERFTGFLEPSHLIRVFSEEHGRRM